MEQAPTIFPLGDSAITIDLADHIDEEFSRKAVAIRDWLISRRFRGVEDIIVAYSSVSVFYDPILVIADSEICPDGAFGCMRSRLQQAWEQASPSDGENSQTITVPVCYGGRFGPDLNRVSEEKGLSPEEIIHLHSSRIYRVYMIGFLPGFPYLGTLDQRLEMPRKSAPVPVVAGSVGIVGNQTAIYPLNSPGGWQIIGLSLIKLFDPQAEIPVRLKIGDHLQFYPVTPEEFDGMSRKDPSAA